MMRAGFDVGGTKTDAVVIDAQGDVLARRRRPTGWGPDALVRTVIELLEELADAVGVAPGAFASIGVGMPGQVAPGTATITHAVNLGVDRLDLGASLGALVGVPVAAENDVKAAAVGAYALHDGGASMAYLNLGTGMAVGYVTRGELWRGARGGAGEIGHISVDPRGPVCKCGQRGCIEVFSGGGSIAQRWGRPGALPVRDVFDAADAGDRRAIELRDGLAFGVAAAVRVIVLSMDVETILLGGGVSALGDRMLSGVMAELERSAAASPFLRSLELTERVRLVPSGSPAAAVGAALIGHHAPRSEEITHG